MKTGFEIFLLTAEELSISHAAQKAFVTQQCVSDHIKRLEQEYGIPLFERKPKLHLTAAGRVMEKSLRNIQLLESNMAASLDSMSEGRCGTLTLGISTSRAPIILPGTLRRYYERFPDVKISFFNEDTQILEDRLLRGDVDLFIGVNTTPNPDFDIHTLAQDEVMLVISSSLLHKHFSDEQISRMSLGIDMAQFTQIPFTLSFRTGKVNRVIEEYLAYYNLQLHIPYNVSDSETQILLCTTGICACLCPRMLLSTAHRHNMISTQSDRLYMFPIKNMNRPLHIDMVTHKNIVQPVFMKEFISILQEEVKILSEDALPGM